MINAYSSTLYGALGDAYTQLGHYAEAPPGRSTG